jgi:hypothetical protein
LSSSFFSLFDRFKKEWKDFSVPCGFHTKERENRIEEMEKWMVEIKEGARAPYVVGRKEVSNVSNPATRPLLTSSLAPFIRPSKLK